MPTAEEAQSAIDLGNLLGEGLRTLSLGEEVPFVQYVRQVLPLDGYVFWMAVQQTTIQGSLHISANKQQREDETIAVNRVVLSTMTPVQQLNQIASDTIWVGTIGGIRFAFSQSGPFYKSAREFHYAGDAVYPALESQLLDIGTPLPSLVVSNSLPAWLALKNYAPFWLQPPNPGITLYPSFAVPDNLRPPYGAVHIEPGGTQALQAAPMLGLTNSHWQLAQDQVRVTLYGVDNDDALTFLDLVYQYIRDTEAIGIMNIPSVRDEKRTQPELGILAMKKTMDFQVSYYQARISDIAQQLIKSVAINFILPSYGAN